jgi:hypothetical protein
VTRRRLAAFAPFAATLAIASTGCGNDNLPGSTGPSPTSGTTTSETHTGTTTAETDTKTTEG